MSTASDALELARRYNVEITVNGDKLRMHAPAEPPAEVVNAIKAAKPDIIAMLSRLDITSPQPEARLPACCTMCGSPRPAGEEWTHAIRGRGDAAALDPTKLPPVPITSALATGEQIAEMSTRTGRKAEPVYAWLTDESGRHAVRLR